jgi:type IV pilus assembly protein PilQ
VEPLLSERGRISVGASSNTLVVMDITRVQDAVESLIQELDIQTPMISIAAKIIFVNRTDLNEFGVIYDLKDSQGNQLNQVTPGAGDLNGDGTINLPEEQVDVGTDVVSLGGSSIAALGNANNRVAGPSLSLLTSLVLGRHTLISFIEALQSVNLSDVEAEPQVSVLDNREARILVGERTPIRVIDANAGGGGGGGGGGGAGGQQQGFAPQATVRIEETGIGLRVTPHVTEGNKIRLTLRAERSAAEIAESDIGLIFRTQEAESQVLVDDGETVVIGGLTVTERTEVRSGIPLLMDLPVVGRFFRTNREQQIQRDLMILVTPTINRPVGN